MMQTEKAKQFLLQLLWIEADMEKKFQKQQGRFVLRGDVVKEDSGSHAVFTEHGCSASHTTAANVLDVISRLPGCAVQEVMQYRFTLK